MSKVGIAAVCLLSVFLCGCPESTNESPKSTRTGSVGGVTSQDIDDLAKPAAKPNDGM
jgi:hypothetical protein